MFKSIILNWQKTVETPCRCSFAKTPWTKKRPKSLTHVTNPFVSVRKRLFSTKFVTKRQHSKKQSHVWLLCLFSNRVYSTIYVFDFSTSYVFISACLLCSFLACLLCSFLACLLCSFLACLLFSFLVHVMAVLFVCVMAVFSMFSVSVF